MNPFLDDGSGELSTLQDGTFSLNVASAVIGDTTPGQPLRINASRKVTSGLIQLADCSFTPLTNPAVANLSMAGYQLTNVARITQPASDRNITIGSTIISTGTINSQHVQIGEESSIAAGAFIGCVVEGYRATASGNAALAAGNTASAGAYATAVGTDSLASLTQNVAVGNISVATGITSTAIGADTVASGFRAIAFGKSATATASESIMVGPFGTNAVANSCKIGGATIASIYPSSSICDLGTVAVRFKDVHASGSIIGSVKTSAVNDVVTNAGASVDQRVAIFSGTTGKLLTDSGATLSQYALLSGPTWTGPVNMGGQNITNGGSITAGAITAGAIVSNAAPVPIFKFGLTTPTVGFATTMAETSLLPGSTIGSLAFGPTTVAGMTIKFLNVWLITMGAATTFTVRLKINGTTFLTSVMAAGAVTNQFVDCQYTLQLGAGTATRIYGTAKITRDLSTTSIATTNADIWTKTATNTLSLTGQFSDVNGAWRGDMFDIFSSH